MLRFHNFKTLGNRFSGKFKSHAQVVSLSVTLSLKLYRIKVIGRPVVTSKAFAAYWHKLNASGNDFSGESTWSFFQ